MTNEEFSNEFDTLLNKDGINPTFDDYQKSVYLTKAQEQLVTHLYNGSATGGDGFEKLEQGRMYLKDLIVSETISPRPKVNEISDNSHYFQFEGKVLFKIYEQLIVDDDKCGKRVLEVVPVTHDDFYKTNDNPFRGPSKRRALRLDIQNDTVEIITPYNNIQYYCRYLRKPNPIILVDLHDGLTINSKHKETECELNSALHRAILEIAVGMAKQWDADSK